MAEQRQDHWNRVYVEKSPDRLSWHQDSPEPSLEAFARFDVGPAQSVIDVGGGISTLVDALLDRGWLDVTVLDISWAALRAAQTRLGARAEDAHWETADITEWTPPRTYDVWHDRAVLHFLTEASQRAAYRAALARGLAQGGLLIIATFALDGPEKCSGLPVMRYDAAAMSMELGRDFRLLDSWKADHFTPWGDRQSFQWCAFRKN